MADISPGYQFGVNEVPTSAKLRLAAAGVVVSNLTADDLPVALQGIIDALESGTSGASLPQEGWIWVDPANNLWVETRWNRPSALSGPTVVRAPCYLIRPSEGGFATRRFYNDGSDASVTPLPNGKGVVTVTTLTPSISDLQGRIQEWHRVQGNYALTQLGGRILGYNIDTSVSGSRPHIIGRGVAPLKDPDMPQDGVGFRDFWRLVKGANANPDFFASSQSAGSLNRYIGVSVGRHLQRGSASVTATPHSLWTFGITMVGN